MIKSKVLTCEMFIKLTLDYLEAINKGGVPSIPTSLENVVAS